MREYCKKYHKKLKKFSRNSRNTRIYEDIWGQTITLILFVVAAVVVAVWDWEKDGSKSL